MYNLSLLYIQRYNISTAADWMVQAIEAGDKYALDQMVSNYDAYPIGFRRKVQEILAERWLYSRPITGLFDEGTIEALIRASKH